MHDKYRLCPIFLPNLIDVMKASVLLLQLALYEIPYAQSATGCVVLNAAFFMSFKQLWFVFYRLYGLYVLLLRASGR